MEERRRQDRQEWQEAMNVGRNRDRTNREEEERRRRGRRREQEAS